MVVHQGHANIVANSAVIAISTFSPTVETAVDLTAGKTVLPGAEAPPGHAIARVSPTFKLVFLTVVTITVLVGVAEIVLAAVWTTPTPNEQTAFEAMDFAWKAGIGAILGLLGGKQT